MFTHDDALWLSETIRGVYAARSPVELAHWLCPAMNDRFHGVVAGVEQGAYNGSTYIPYKIIHHFPPTYDMTPYVHDSPVWLKVAGGNRSPTVQLRTSISQTKYRRTDHYNGLARVGGFSDQIALCLYGATDFLAVSVFRDRPFTDGEHAILRSLRPHLRAAWTRLRLAEYSSPQPHVIPVLPDGRLGSVSASVAELFRHYFPSYRRKDVIPEQLRDWFRDAVQGVQGATSNRPLCALTADSLRGRLYARFHPGTAETPGHVVLFERPSMPNFLLLRKEGLSTRECEVLRWMAEGKRNAEIAAIVGAAPRTVDKHAEHLLRKLRAETRTGAVLAARQSLSTLEAQFRRDWR